MKKIGFVTPWYGDKIPGGAEADLRGLVKHMSQLNIDLEILTTCVKDFNSDWATNYHKEGLSFEPGLTEYSKKIPVRRFKADERDKEAFDRVNAKLMKGDFELSFEDQETFVKEMVNSKALYEYIKTHKDEYHAFVYTPYMFGTTYYGVEACPEKAILIPCFHDEAYTFMDVFKDQYKKAAGMVFHATPEQEMIRNSYDLSKVKIAEIGDGMDVDLSGNGQRFRDKYQIHTPYILYAGRKDAGKNIYLLMDYFKEYKKRNQNNNQNNDQNKNNLKLILIGGGSLDIPEDMKDEIIDLGFLPIQDKYDAYAGATFFCQPSRNESFSLVIMESWLCKRPVLVYEKCAVTTNFAKKSKGGLYFKNYFDFEGAVNYFLSHEEVCKQMGENGSQFVKENFSWDVIVEKYYEFIKQVGES